MGSQRVRHNLAIKPPQPQIFLPCLQYFHQNQHPWTYRMPLWLIMIFHTTLLLIRKLILQVIKAQQSHGHTVMNFTMSEKAMAPHSSTLAWKIPWMEEPGRLQSMGSPRVGRDRVTSLSLFTFMHRRRKWQPTPVFLPGESQGQGSLVGCHLWGHTESDTTEAT